MAFLGTWFECSTFKECILMGQEGMMPASGMKSCAHGTLAEQTGVRKKVPSLLGILVLLVLVTVLSPPDYGIHRSVEPAVAVILCTITGIGLTCFQVPVSSSRRRISGTTAIVSQRSFPKAVASPRRGSEFF